MSSQEKPRQLATVPAATGPFATLSLAAAPTGKQLLFACTRTVYMTFVGWICATIVGCSSDSNNLTPGEPIAFQAQTVTFFGSSSLNPQAHLNFQSRDFSSFQKLNSLPPGRSDVAVVVFQGRIWMAGGKDGSQLVQTAVFCSDDGVVWQKQSDLPSARSGGQLIGFKDTLFYIGGRDSGGLEADTIFQSRDGKSWAAAGKISQARTDLRATIFQDRLFLAGGSPLTDEVWVSDDGINYSLHSHLPQALSAGLLLATANQLIFAGGATNANSVATVYAISSQQSTNWTAIGSLPEARSFSAGFVRQNKY